MDMNKKINEMDEQLAKWIIDVSIDDGNFKGPAVNIIKIIERSYWLAGEAVLGQSGHLPNIHIRFMIGEKAEIQIHTIKFNPDNLDWKPSGHWPIWNTSVIIKKLLDEGYSIPPLENEIDEYAKEIAIGFHEWYMNNVGSLPAMELEQLYNLYLQSLNQKL
jgi:hypothetical protein